MKKKVIAMLLASVLAVSTLAGCGGKENAETPASSNTENQQADDQSDAPSDDQSAESEASSGEVTDFTMFITMPGSEINSDNEIAQMIADKWGVKVKETWLTGQTAAEATGTLIASGEYPDFIDSDDMGQLVDA